uniref:Uncharacterized protein n=1 Tax=Musca domestica TaxID=7370 RepID=A0A1I8NBB6_MUSDO
MALALQFFRTIFALTIYYESLGVAAILVFKKLECQAIDPEYVNFTLCELNANSRSSSISLTGHILQLPITNADVNFVFEHSSQNKLPTMNATWDACSFLKNRKRNLALNRFFNYLAPYTNVNHSCPYKSVNLAQHEGRRRFPDRPMPTGEILRHLAARPEDTGTTKGAARQTVAAVAEDVMEEPSTSTKRRATQME